MTSAQVVETSVISNSSFQNLLHPDDHTRRTKGQSVLFMRYCWSVQVDLLIVIIGVARGYFMVGIRFYLLEVLNFYLYCGLN